MYDDICLTFFYCKVFPVEKKQHLGVARAQNEWDIEGGWKGRRLKGEEGKERKEGGVGGGEEWSGRGEKR